MSALKKWFDRRRQHGNQSEFGPIGVYLTQEHLHLVQLRKCDDDRIEIHRHQSLSFPGGRTDLLAAPRAVQKLVRRAMRAGKFRGRKVVSAMPPEHVRVMSISYPASNAGNEVATITKIMSDRLDGALEKYVIDYVPIRTSSNDGDQLALIAVSDLEYVNSYLSALDSAGLHIDHLEIGSLAIKRLVEWGSAPNNFGNVIVVNIGDMTSHLTTISGRRLLADQEIKFGDTTILDALSTALNLDQTQARQLILTHGFGKQTIDASRVESDADADVADTLIEISRPVFQQLAREIDRAFLYADSESRGDGSKKLFVVGGVTHWPGATTLIGSLTKVRVETLGCDQLPRTTEREGGVLINAQKAAEISTAVGLAMRGMVDNE